MSWARRRSASPPSTQEWWSPRAYTPQASSAPTSRRELSRRPRSAASVRPMTLPASPHSSLPTTPSGSPASLYAPAAASANLSKRRTLMGKLGGKTAVITAATSGMALATAKLFVEEGAYVFITGRRKEKLDEAVKLIGRDATPVHAHAT